ncbi:MAG: TDP-N-acetylfucosamine:lipid II N-acetylfucosaminyltransferase [Paludibacteraceae bacterium]|nr:TDP-N-acetylfucosamine:lipid II N-acetylfucosaminyltransferase [Paludibacteraceae bacterium]
MKILHLITDHQVIERTLGVYESIFPGSNDVLVFSQDANFQRLKNDYLGKLVNRGNLDAIASSYDFSNVTYVIAHYLTMDKIDFIKYVPKDIHVCWEIYGADLYDQFLEPKGYKMYYTSPLDFNKYGFYKKHLPFLFKCALYSKFRDKYIFNHQIDKQYNYICERVNSLQYCCKYDASFVEEHAHRTIHSYEIFNYSLSTVLGELKNVDFYEGSDILVGNSASFSNNHIYVMNYLKKANLPESIKYILPLSYGGNQLYADYVEKTYKSVFGNKIETFRNYIPLHEYNKTFLRLKAVILSAWRQESQGTAIMAFYLGLKVFMSEKSPLYKWFVDCGFIVFTIEKSSSNDYIEPLTLDEKRKNREIVLNRYSESCVVETFKKELK